MKNQVFALLSGFFVKDPSDLNKAMKNFADSNSGASVLSTSKGVINKKSILVSNPDSYLMIPGCHKDREDFVIINLADDVRIETIIVSNKEDFSARFS